MLPCTRKKRPRSVKQFAKSSPTSGRGKPTLGMPNAKLQEIKDKMEGKKNNAVHLAYKRPSALKGFLLWKRKSEYSQKPVPYICPLNTIQKLP